MAVALIQLVLVTFITASTWISSWFDYGGVGYGVSLCLAFMTVPKIRKAWLAMTQALVIAATGCILWPTMDGQPLAYWYGIGIAALIPMIVIYSFLHEIYTRKTAELIAKREAECLTRGSGWVVAPYVSPAPPEPPPPPRVPIWLHVPYAEKDEAKALGAKWDRSLKLWFVPRDINPDPFAKWIRRLPYSD